MRFKRLGKLISIFGLVLAAAALAGVGSPFERSRRGLLSRPTVVEIRSYQTLRLLPYPLRLPRQCDVPILFFYLWSLPSPQVATQLLLHVPFAAFHEVCLEVVLMQLPPSLLPCSLLLAHFESP